MCNEKKKCGKIEQELEILTVLLYLIFAALLLYTFASGDIFYNKVDFKNIFSAQNWRLKP